MGLDRAGSPAGHPGWGSPYSTLTQNNKPEFHQLTPDSEPDSEFELGLSTLLRTMIQLAGGLGGVKGAEPGAGSASADELGKNTG